MRSGIASKQTRILEIMAEVQEMLACTGSSLP
jgi:hypothetical protein